VGDATFDAPDLTAFCRLDDLGLVVVTVSSSTQANTRRAHRLLASATLVELRAGVA